jgi:hypothetical protein
MTINTAPCLEESVTMEPLKYIYCMLVKSEVLHHRELLRC